MKNLRKVALMTIFFSLLMAKLTFADQWDWENARGHHNQSVLLSGENLSSEDSVLSFARGDYLAEGSVQITNMQDSSIRIDIATLAYRNVDKIMHTVYLDIWEEDYSDWRSLDCWEFELTKEEVENQELYMLQTRFFLTGYETNRYYRLRGLHGVEYNDELEACATETNGVLITDGPT